MGQAPSGATYNDQHVGLPLISGAGDFDGDYPQTKKFTSAPTKISQTGDIILGIRASIGDKVWADGIYCLGRGVAALRPFDVLDKRYLWHWMDVARPALIAKSRGATFRQVTRGDIAELNIPLPRLEEQRRIAAVLDKADHLRAKRRQALALLETLVEALYQSMFVPSAANWRRVPLDEAYWFQEGPGVRNWQFTAEGIKLLNVGNIEGDGSLNLDKTSRRLAEKEAYGKYKHFLVDEGDLVIASSGIGFDRDGLLRTRGAFVERRHLPLCMNTSTIRFKPLTADADLYFLRAWLNQPEFRSQITRRVTGSAQQNFGPSHLKSIVITLPPIEKQTQFAAKVREIERQSALDRKALTTLDDLFSSYRYRAFGGEL